MRLEAGLAVFVHSGWPARLWRASPPPRKPPAKRRPHAEGLPRARATPAATRAAPPLWAAAGVGRHCRLCVEEWPHLRCAAPRSAAPRNAGPRRAGSGGATDGNCARGCLRLGTAEVPHPAVCTASAAGRRAGTQAPRWWNGGGSWGEAHARYIGGELEVAVCVWWWWWWWCVGQYGRHRRGMCGRCVPSL